MEDILGVHDTGVVNTVSHSSSRSESPADGKFILQPMPKYEPNHKALHLATLHRVAAVRRPRTAGASSRTIQHRRSRSRLSQNATDTEADTKSQTTESDWMDFLDNDDFDYDAEDEPPPPGPLDKEDACQRMYRGACRIAKIPPATSVVRGLPQKEISLKHHIIGPEGAKTIAIAMTHNGTVEKLDLQENNLGPLGTSYISEMLLENDYITDLSLTENVLGTEGARLICNVLKENETIKRLDLSGNGFKEKDALMFLDMLRENYTLRELILNHNEFREEGGEIIAKALADNTYLEELDLSWNHLRNRGASALGKCLTHNIGLKSLNISWNGFHLDGCRQIGKALATNHSLVNLNLNNNRIDRECLSHLLGGLRRNSCLECLMLDQNPIGTEGALDILDAIAYAKDPNIKEVDISSVTVDVDFKQRKRAMAEAGRCVFILHGHTLHEDEATHVDAEGVFLNDDPMTVLMEFMRIKNLRLVDLFTSMDKDGSGAITKQEFRDGLLKANVPLSANALIRLVKKLDLDRDGEVDFGELMKGQKDHKRRVNKMKKMAQERGWSFEETEVGRVSMKLQQLMNIGNFRKGVRPVTSIAKAITGMRLNLPPRAKTAAALRTPAATQMGLLTPYNVSTTDIAGTVTPGGSVTDSPAASRPGSRPGSAVLSRVGSRENSRPGSAVRSRQLLNSSPVTGAGSRPGSGTPAGSTRSVGSRPGSGVSSQGLSRPNSAVSTLMSKTGSEGLDRPPSGRQRAKSAVSRRPLSGIKLNNASSNRPMPGLAGKLAWGKQLASTSEVN